MKKNIKALINNPIKVIVLSIIISLTIGFWVYWGVNRKVTSSVSLENSTREALSPRNLTLGFLSSGRIKSVSVKVGDIVKKGQILAELDAGNTVGSLTQAKALYATAEANYQKIINGATGPTIDIAKAAVNTAKVNLDQITNQQNTVVDNAYRNFLNSTPEAVPDESEDNYIAPVISGNYNLGKEGTIKLNFYYSTGGVSFNVSGIASGSGSCNTITSQPIGNSGLFIKCLQDKIDTKDWNIEIPNKKASNYITNYNGYQLSLQTRKQATEGAKALLDQAQAALSSLVSSARPEDVSIAQAQINSALGSVQIAQAAYNNTIIVSPLDGEITSVVITAGQIATINASAIELKTNDSLK